MSLVEVIIDSIQYSETQTGAYILFLKEPVSDKKLPIVIGSLEAHSIVIGMEKNIVPERPLTHDLMKSIMDTFQINLKKIIINKLDQGVFYALLVVEKDGVSLSIDSRTSDAVALAVRYEVPIFCESNIIEEAGIVLPKTEKTVEQKVDNEDLELEDIISLINNVVDKSEEQKASQDELIELEKLSKALFGKKTVIFTRKEVEDMLQTAIEDEQYERAGMLKRFLELM